MRQNASKPGIKEIETRPIPGFVCDVCGIKYRIALNKTRCENWHSAVDSKE